MILPGLVDPESGVIRYMPHIAVENWGLVGALEKRFNVTCFVGHDIRSLALAGALFWRKPGLRRLHSGARAPRYRGGDYLQRAHFLSAATATSAKLAIFRSTRWANRCHCGNFGCLETVAANAAIEQRVRHLLEQGYQSRLTPDDCTIKTICKAANKGDALACEVIEYVGRHLGKTIAIAINLFNPQKSSSPAK